MTPFLSIITRCCKRPTLLGHNIRSVRAQTDQDIEQVFLVDRRGRGVPWANSMLHRNRHRAVGRYVYILDDDCRLINRNFVKELKKFTKAHPEADVIMVRSKRPQLAPHLLPRDAFWGRRVKMLSKRVNCLCYVVRGSFWRQYIDAFQGRSGAGLFMGRLLKTSAKFAWLDMVVAETQQIGRGKKFEKCSTRRWWGKVAGEHGIQKYARGDWRLKFWGNG